MTQRSNQDWLDELCGKRGQTAQQLAHQDLAKYLFVVAYNYLRKRQEDTAILRNFAPQELAELAQDFIQEVMEKLARNNYALLNQFRGIAYFTSWTAQIVRNQIGIELRKSYWTRRELLSDETEENNPVAADLTTHTALASPHRERTLEEEIINKQLKEVIENCLEVLPERNKMAFVQCIRDEDRVKTVAEQLGTSENAVYQLVYRAKRLLRKCLYEADLF